MNRLHTSLGAVAVSITLGCTVATALQKEAQPSGAVASTPTQGSQQTSNRQQASQGKTSPPTNNLPAKQPDGAAMPQSSNASPWWKSPDWWQVALVVLGTVIAVWALLADRRAVRLTQRADVLIEKVGMITPAPLGLHSIVEVTLKNFGPTRANRLDVALWLGLAESREGEDAPLPMIVFAPGCVVCPRFPPLGEWLPAAAIAGVTEGQTRLVYKGTVSYVDVFGRRHTVDCAGTYEPAQNAFRIERNEST
jgi:hypothetical protein